MAPPRILFVSLLALGAAANPKRHVKVEGRKAQPVPVVEERDPAPLAMEELSWSEAGVVEKRQYCYSDQFLCGSYCCYSNGYDCDFYSGVYSTYATCSFTGFDYSTYSSYSYSSYSYSYPYDTDSSSSHRSKGSKFPAKAIAGVVVGVIALLVAIIGGVFAFLKKRRASKSAAASNSGFGAAAPAYTAAPEKGPAAYSTDATSPMAPPPQSPFQPGNQMYGAPVAGAPAVYQSPQSPPPVHQPGYQPPQSPPMGQQQPYQPPSPLNQQPYQPPQSPQVGQQYYPVPVPAPQGNVGQPYYPPPNSAELGPGK